MDVNQDGKVDILSGSYSRTEGSMAGLFQVLWGEGNGKFRRAEVLNGSDGEPLILTTSGSNGDADIERICTRAFAVDLNGDGHLDIVSGNFRGTFGFFAGEGKSKFSPRSTWLADPDGKPLQVDAHSDPCLVDWDGDGDYDLVSGSSAGGAFLFVNEGTKTQPKWGERRTLVPSVGHELKSQDTLGDQLQHAQRATRVWVDDVDGDGKLDLLIGDSASLCFPADGVSEADVKKRLPEWHGKMAKLLQSTQQDGRTQEGMERFRKAYTALQEERAQVVRDDHTGFVWLYRQK